MKELIGRVGNSRPVQLAIEMVTGRLDKESQKVLDDYSLILQGDIADPEQILEIRRRGQKFKSKVFNLWLG